MVGDYNTTYTGENTMDKEQCMLDARILQTQGYTQMQIEQLFGVTDKTVRAYLKERACGRKKPIRASRLDPFNLDSRKIIPREI